jgi:DNA polymerase I-like protein with 3'-5' exonuclease and polymerase domains/uracil-DNA glycosylase
VIPPSGPVPAKIMLVGEAPGETEMRRREPFVGASGQLLNEMLHEAGIMRSECFLTNVCRLQPPGNDIELWIPKIKKRITEDMVPLRDKMVKPIVLQGWEMLCREVDMVKPNIIVAFGNVSMWALTGKWGIKSWRGSLLSTEGLSSLLSPKVIPIYHPAYIMRDWSARAISVQDLRRVKAETTTEEITGSEYNFLLRPSYSAAISHLESIHAQLEKAPTTISCDIETRGGHIACVGLALDKQSAICIPFMCVERPDGYWLAEEELGIVLRLRKVLTHPNAKVLGQNFIYDTQYFYRHWGYVPRFDRDTMLGHHSCFTTLPKGLDYLSSMYCERHVYWKAEGKNWDRKTGEDQLWAYNCKDAVITYECDEGIQATVDKLGLREQSNFQQEMFWPVLQAMIRGVRVDTARRSDFALELQDEISKREEWFIKVLGHPLNPRSPLQMKRLFYEDLKQREIYSRASGNLTLDDEALDKIAAREPLLRPLVRRINEYRSLGVFLSTFVGAKLDRDQRLRCSYNIAGTSTLRLSSSKDAFGSGLNLQNIPAGGDASDDNDALQLPNVKTLFIPDEGYTFFDCDLDRADLQVVAWEADDADLKDGLRRKLDMHLHSARAVYDLAISDDEMLESHPNYGAVKARYYVKRQTCKQIVHATNYVGSARTVAAALGLTIHEVDRFQRRWFDLHPGIKKWHERVEHQLKTKKYVENRYGFRRYSFDRIDSELPEAIAWIPQSTVGHFINRIWLNIYRRVPEVQVLLQVHDSLAGQFPTRFASICKAQIHAIASQVAVPYDDPLIIPLSIKTSTKSWGDCK